MPKFPDMGYHRLAKVHYFICIWHMTLKNANVITVAIWEFTLSFNMHSPLSSLTLFLFTTDFLSPRKKKIRYMLSEFNYNWKVISQNFMLWKSYKPREDVCEKITQVLLGEKKNQTIQQGKPHSKLEFSKMPKDVEHWILDCPLGSDPELLWISTTLYTDVLQVPVWEALKIWHPK